MWYYELNRQPFGPENVRGITRALQSGEITSETLICRAGSTDWIRLAESELSFLVSQRQTEQSAVTEEPRQKSRTSLRAKRLLPALTIALSIWGLLVVAGLAAIIYTFINNGFLSSGAVFLAAIFLVVAELPKLYLLFQFWGSIQDKQAHTTPGKALGFMFIPLFNYYWLYPAWVGLAKDQNRYVARHFKGSVTNWVSRSHAWLAFIYVFLCWLGVLFIVYQVLGFVVNYFATAYIRWPFSLLDGGVILFAAILFAAQAFMQLPMMLDFYLTTRAILKGKANS